MDNLLGGNVEGGLNLGNNPLEQWFFEMPPCTRYWTVATVVTSVLLQCKVISPLQLFYTFRAVYFKSQVSPLPPNLSKYNPRPLSQCTQHLEHLRNADHVNSITASSQHSPTSGPRL